MTSDQTSPERTVQQNQILPPAGYLVGQLKAVRHLIRRDGGQFPCRSAEFHRRLRVRVIPHAGLQNLRRTLGGKLITKSKGMIVVVHVPDHGPQLVFKRLSLEKRRSGPRVGFPDIELIEISRHASRRKRTPVTVSGPVETDLPASDPFCERFLKEMLSVGFLLLCDRDGPFPFLCLIAIRNAGHLNNIGPRTEKCAAAVFPAEFGNQDFPAFIQYA